MSLAGNFPRVSNDVMVRVDGWRGPLTGAPGSGSAHKEWMHFCVALPGGGHVLANLSVADEDAGAGARRTPRLVVLAWDGRWSGKIATYGAGQIEGQPGRLNVRLAQSAFEWRDGAFRIVIDLDDIAADLRLLPLSPPTVESSVTLPRDRTLHWVVVPRLSATGWLRVGSQVRVVEGALAYHDHNWGDFRWGSELSWEWGFVHSSDAENPWDLVVARVSDGAGHKAISQAALLWRAGRLVRVFQNRELLLTPDGAAPRERPFTVPPVASLLAPGIGTKVPDRFHLRAEGNQDELDLSYRIRDRARIALPSETDALGLVLLNETCGTARVRGNVANARFDFESTAMMEFVGV